MVYAGLLDVYGMSRFGIQPDNTNENRPTCLSLVFPVLIVGALLAGLFWLLWR